MTQKSPTHFFIDSIFFNDSSNIQSIKSYTESEDIEISVNIVFCNHVKNNLRMWGKQKHF